jgi:5-methyltetrahydropteroyltriglutamate--homocysteine methyltransferase
MLGAGKIIAWPGLSRGEEMPDRILTSHAGSLPRPEDLIALNEQRAEGDFSNEDEYLGRLRAAVADVVARQRETGIDLVNDGEFGHSMGIGVN